MWPSSYRRDGGSEVIFSCIRAREAIPENGLGHGFYFWTKFVPVMIIREEEYKFRKKTVFYLLAFLHSVFRSDHLQRLRSCALIGPRTSKCPDE